MREFSPAREEEVIVMQQVTDIYGRENGGDDPAHPIKASYSRRSPGSETSWMSITLLSGTYVDFGIAKGLSRAPANRLGTVLSPKGIPLVRVAAPDPSQLGPAAQAPRQTVNSR